MPRQPYTVYRPSRTARDLEIQNRQRDGNPGSLIQHPVEATVLGIVVVALVASKSEILEQVDIGPRDELGPAQTFRFLGQFNAHFIQPLQIRTGKQGRE